MDWVFLHGGEQGSWIWDETIAALHLQAPGQHRTFALDVPGCGIKRGRETGEIAFADIVAELAADVTATGYRDVVLVGHSQAGTVLPRLARALPGAFRRLVYVSCVAPEPGRGVAEEAHHIHATPGRPLHNILGNADVPYRDQLRAAFCNDMTSAEAEQFLDRLGEDHWPQSSWVFRDFAYGAPSPVPASYVLCLIDEILPPDAQRRFAERFGCERIASIEAGHQVQNTRPHGLAEILRNEGGIGA